jgi:hypothetical protein
VEGDPGLDGVVIDEPDVEGRGLVDEVSDLVPLAARLTKSTRLAAGGDLLRWRPRSLRDC